MAGSQLTIDDLLTGRPPVGAPVEYNSCWMVGMTKEQCQHAWGWVPATVIDYEEQDWGWSRPLFMHLEVADGDQVKRKMVNYALGEGTLWRRPQLTILWRPPTTVGPAS